MIESPKNEKIKKFRRLRKRNFRYREGMFLVEGLQCVAEALNSRWTPHCLICNDRGIEAMQAYADVIHSRSIPCYSTSDEVIATLADTVTPQGVIAVSPLVHVEIKTILDKAPETILVADRVRDPGNLGGMVRIADAAGVKGMVICSESVDLYNAKTVRSTAGSLYHLDISVGEDIRTALRRLREAGYNILAADAHSGTGMWEVEWPRRLALVMGNEAWGIPEEEAALADGRVCVPMLGEAESLNVSAATAVLLYELERRRRTDHNEEGDR